MKISKSQAKQFGQDVADLIVKFGGWVEGDIVRFPSVWNKEQFEKANRKVV